MTKRFSFAASGGAVYTISMDHGINAPFEIRVDSHSGHRDGERPYRIRMGTHALAVREIPDRWYDPDAGYFKLLCDDGNIYLVRHDLTSDRWSLTQFLKSAGGARR